MSAAFEPFAYRYMIDAIWVAALVGGVCGFLSCYLMLKGWSLIGDALSHSVVPGVAIAGLLGLPFALGAFVAGGLAAAAMLALQDRSGLKSDVVIGLIFTAFFGLGLFIVSVAPMAVSIQTIVMGNILAITPADTVQLALIGGVTLAVLLVRWRDLMAVFFDETHARTIGLRPFWLKTLFFTLLSASVVAGMQTVGAFLVIALVVITGYSGMNPWLILPATVILFREVFVSGLREFLGDKARLLKVTRLAKWKTTAQMVAIAILFLGTGLNYYEVGHPPLVGETKLPWSDSWSDLATQIGLLLIWVAAALTAITGWDYFDKARPYLRDP